MNGQRGTVTATDPHTRTVTVAWDGRHATVVSAGYLDAGHLDHGYAITGHRAQGLTVDHTWIQTSDTLYREWGYVAASRGRHDNRLYTTADGVPFDAEELDHGAWQSSDSTARQRLATQLGRTNAQTAAIDQALSPRPIAPIPVVAADRTHHEASPVEQALGID
jgi:ATP-dependent exoDNAse (exonuclease V) alpha subunit